jgi:hypothetical protein
MLDFLLAHQLSCTTTCIACFCLEVPQCALRLGVVSAFVPDTALPDSALSPRNTLL